MFDVFLKARGRNGRTMTLATVSGPAPRSRQEAVMRFLNILQNIIIKEAKQIMTKKKSTKRALISSLLILAMCFTMLAGTTFAWFTDSVTSGSNIIKSGKLDIDLLVKGGNIDTATYGTDYVSLDANPGLAIFDYDLWEPGYTVVAYAKVVNNGNLALKYTMKIAATGTASKLADVIDVYYAPSEVAVAYRDLANNAGLVRLGTLTEVLAGGANVTINDYLLAGAPADFATIALQMQTTAGNEYQELSIGSGFTLQILATQYTYEEDSFDDQYDVNAEYPTAYINGNAITRPLTAADFTANSTIELVEPFADTVDLPNGITVIGNGNELHATVTGNKEITLKNVDSKYVKTNNFTGTLTFEGGTLSTAVAGSSSNADAPFYNNTGEGTFIFKDMTVTAGATKGIKISKAKEVVIDGCVFDAGNMNPSATDTHGAGQTQYDQRSMSMIDIQEQNVSGKMAVTIKNCTFIGAPQGKLVNDIADTDTAGAIKLKAEEQGFSSVTIENNTFTNCYRDVAVGVNVLISNNAFVGIKNPAGLKNAMNNVADTSVWHISGNHTNGDATRGFLIASNGTKAIADKVGEEIGGATVYYTCKTAKFNGTEDVVTANGIINA